MYRLRIGFDDYSVREFAEMNRFSLEKAKAIMDNGKAIFDYVESIASQNIVRALRELDRQRFYYSAIGLGFFSHVGGYFGMTDDGFGISFTNKKLDRMEEKLLDREEAFTFDVFEEYLFTRLLIFVEGKYDDPEKEEEIYGKLAEEFGYVLLLPNRPKRGGHN